MVTDIVILALISNRPKHGYEIKKEVGQILERETKMNNNLLYPALRRLEKEGAVKSEIQEQEGLPKRHVYSITETGQELFKRLISRYQESDMAKEEEFLTRIAFFEMLNEKEQLQLLEWRLKEINRRIEHNQKVRSSFSHKFNSPWVSKVLDYRGKRLKEEAEWIIEMEGFIKKEGV